MGKALVIATIGEAATGLALLVLPQVVARLLFGEALTGAGVLAAKVAGIALIALAIGCWRGSAAVGMLVYSGAVTLFLAWVGVADGRAGLLLWPAVALHGILTIALLYEWARRR
jgi:hypothetical protein